jgi:hypothetical protein
LQGKTVHRRKTLHGNQEKGCKEEKETLTVCETILRIGPKEFSREASQEKHLLRGFLISAVSLQPSPKATLLGASHFAGTPTLALIWIILTIYSDRVALTTEDRRLRFRFLARIGVVPKLTSC